MAGGGCGRGLGSQDSTVEALSQNLLVEVGQQAAHDAGEAEVGDQVGEIDVLDGLDTLDFHEDLAIDNWIEAVAAVELDGVVGDREWNLALDVVAALGRLLAKTRLEGGLEEAKAERAMDGAGRADHDPGQRVVHVIEFRGPVAHRLPLRCLRLCGASRFQMIRKSVRYPIDTMRT